MNHGDTSVRIAAEPRMVRERFNRHPTEAEWRGRFEIIDREPLTIFDGAHNPQGICSAVESIKKYFGDEKLFVVTGVLSDKDHAYIAERLSEIAERAFVMTPDNPRALSADSYAEELRGFGVDATPYPTLKEAFFAGINEACNCIKPLVCLGSLYTYAELIKYC
jgi:dihydrofolate synthase/folylpolyglutamate synthase